MTVKLANIKTTEITHSFKDNLIQFYSDIVPLLNGSEMQKTIWAQLSARGLDRIYTSLKRMPYQKFYCTKAPDGLVYLCGKTEDMIYEIHGDEFNVGPYHVAISTKSLRARQNNPVHVFPDYNPTTRARHLHHVAYANDDRWRSDKPIKHPLLATPNWCWASIGPSYLSAVADYDIVDAFRILYIFLIRLNWHSPLSHSWEDEAIEMGERV